MPQDVSLSASDKEELAVHMKLFDAEGEKWIKSGNITKE